MCMVVKEQIGVALLGVDLRWFINRVGSACLFQVGSTPGGLGASSNYPYSYKLCVLWVCMK
jgi:hypothetical protein